MKTGRSFPVFAGLLLLSVPGVGHAFSIFSVTLIPGQEIPPPFEVQMVVNITTPSMPAYVYQPTEVSISGSNVFVDIFPTSGMLTVIGGLHETVTVGTLPVGSYQYEVRLHPNFPVNWGTRTNRGTFSVVPGAVTNLPVAVAVHAADSMASEPGGPAVVDSGRFTISRSGSTNFPIVVFYKLSGSASNSVDYAALANSVFIPAGQSSADVLVTPLHDVLSEATETVVLTIQPPACIMIYPPPRECYVVGAPAHAMVNIFDNDGPTNQTPPVISIVARDPVASEGTNCFHWPGWPSAHPPYPHRTNTATFVVSRAGPTNGALTVFYSINGTASNSVDYVALPGTVDIPAGQRTASVTVIPRDDGLVEPVETVVLTLQPGPEYLSIPPRYTIGQPRKAAAIIVDNDRPRPGNSWLSDGCFHLTRPAANGECYRVESSTDLVHWTPLCAAVVSDGAFHFVDPDAGGFPSRFYRVVPDAVPASE